MASSITKRLLLYATDTYKLSSLILRNVLLIKPATLKSYQEKTRQVLLDSANKSSNSNNNVTAIKLLELDKELNLIQYYGIQEYTKRWWNSSIWSYASSITSFSSSSKDKKDIPQTSNKINSKKHNDKNVARVSFMITSKQRYILSTQLGYTTQDIRSFKPIEALLLIEHGIKRNEESNHDSNNDDSFRIKLKKLMKENDRLMNIQHQQSSQQQQSVEAEGIDTATPTKHENANADKQVDESKPRIEQSSTISPEISQQIHVKPDVAAALLSVDGDVTNHEIVHSREIKEKKEDTATEIAICDATTEMIDNLSTVESVADTSAEPSAVVSDTTTTAPKPVSLVTVSSTEAEDMHMKPDVAAVILSSHQQRQDDNSAQQQLHVHETVIEEGSSEEEIEEDGTCWYEVIQAIPSSSTASGGEENEQVVALFPTKKEALEFRKQSLNRAKGGENCLVRRRWNA